MKSEEYYKNKIIRLERINRFVKRNILNSILNKLIWLKENGGDIDHAIEYIKSQIKENRC